MVKGARPAVHRGKTLLILWCMKALHAFHVQYEHPALQKKISFPCTTLKTKGLFYVHIPNNIEHIYIYNIPLKMLERTLIDKKCRKRSLLSDVRRKNLHQQLPRTKGRS